MPGGKGEWVGTETQRDWIKAGKVIRSELALHMGLLIESNETQRDKDHQSVRTDDTFSLAHIFLRHRGRNGGKEFALLLFTEKTNTYTLIG